MSAQYARRLLEFRWEDLPPAVQAQARRCLKDILATAAGCLALPAAGQAADFVGGQFAAGDVPLWFRAKRSSLTGAAFCNALTTDALDCHDGFRPNKGHCGATVVPVALGACSLRPGSGAELLTAIVMGYELACRAGLVIHRLCAPVVHASGAWAALGAAAAGARLLGIGAERLDSVLGVAEYYAPMSPILRCTASPSIVKDGAGAGAWSAAMALAMQEGGMGGLPSLFTAEPLGREQASTLGEDWMILRQYFKLYPTCRWTHPPAEGLLALQREHGFRAADVEAIDVETFAEAVTLMRFPPEDSDGAQYCLPWALAAALVDGRLGVEQVHPDRLSDPAIIALGRRVRARAVPDLQARFPAECLARVTVALRDGRRLSGPTRGARGDWTDPASDTELDAKFERLVAGTLGAEACARLGAVLEALDRHPAADLLGLL